MIVLLLISIEVDVIVLHTIDKYGGRDDCVTVDKYEGRTDCVTVDKYGGRGDCVTYCR